MEIDPRFRDQIEGLLEKHDLLKFDRLMEYHGYFDELPLFAQYDEAAFLDDLPFDERNRVLIRAAAAHLERILDYSREYYAGREYDYFCAVTVTNWEFFDEGDLVIPRFWYANPSHGVFDFPPFGPPASKYSRLLAEWLDSPDYVINEDVVHEPFEDRVERVWAQHVSCLAPFKQGQEEA